MFPKLRTALATVAIVMGVTSCGGDVADGDGDSAVNAQAAIVRGWKAYAERDFAIALVEFERASNLDDTQPDAHNGLGWTRLHLLRGEPSADVLALAAESFAAALRADGTFADAWVGMGQALYMTRTDAAGYLDAAKALTAARDGDGSTLYRHDYTSEARLRALEAWCYYYAGEPIAAASVARAASELDANVPAIQALVQLTR